MSVPATATYFFGYEVVGKRLLPPLPSPLAQDLATGLVAQLLAGLVFTGVDLVKERVQVAPLLAQPATAASVLRGVLAARGARGLMTGYWVTNAVWWVRTTTTLPGGGELVVELLIQTQGLTLPTISWSMHVPLKKGTTNCKSCTTQERHHQLQVMYHISCAHRVPWNMLYTAAYEDLRRRSLSTPVASLAAAAAATVATHPIDVVKTRVQVSGLHSRQVVARLLAKEGPSALLHGLTARLLTIVPGTCVSWLVYEQAKAWLGSGRKSM